MRRVGSTAWQNERLSEPWSGRLYHPMDLAELIPLALERKAPVVIDVPFGDMPIPRAPQIAPLYALPWTMPQKGRIDS